MNIIETLAFDYITFAEKNEFYNAYFIYLFSLVFGLVKKVTQKMQRATYFLNIALVFFVGSLSQIIWFYALSAMSEGYLFIIVFLDLIIWAAVGYVLIVITKSRSNDAYGHSRLAVLGFIPIAGFWLLFTASKDNNPVKMPSYMAGGYAVIIGLVVLVGGQALKIALETSLDKQITSQVTAETSNKIASKYLAYNIAKNGLPSAFEFLKSQNMIGSKIDEVTILENIEATEDTIIFKYLITDNKIMGFSKSQQKQWLNHICTNFEKIIEADGTVIFDYSSNSKQRLARVKGNSINCS